MRKERAVVKQRTEELAEAMAQLADLRDKMAGGAQGVGAETPSPHCSSLTARLMEAIAARAALESKCEQLQSDLAALRRVRIAELLMVFPIRLRTSVMYEVGGLLLPSSTVLGSPAAGAVGVVALSHVVHALHVLSSYLGMRLPRDMRWRQDVSRVSRPMTRAIRCEDDAVFGLCKC